MVNTGSAHRLRGYVGGRFRGNWRYGFNASPSGELDSVDMSGAGTLSALARAAISPGTGVHYITNNLPYAERIENGWSRQARRSSWAC